MMPHWLQISIITLAVAAAAGYIGVKTWRRLTSPCGGGCGCGTKKTAEPSGATTQSVSLTVGRKPHH